MLNPFIKCSVIFAFVFFGYDFFLITKQSISLTTLSLLLWCSFFLCLVIFLTIHRATSYTSYSHHPLDYIRTTSVQHKNIVRLASDRIFASKCVRPNHLGINKHIFFRKHGWKHLSSFFNKCIPVAKTPLQLSATLFTLTNHLFYCHKCNKLCWHSLNKVGSQTIGMDNWDLKHRNPVQLQTTIVYSEHTQFVDLGGDMAGRWKRRGD